MLRVTWLLTEVLVVPSIDADELTNEASMGVVPATLLVVRLTA